MDDIMAMIETYKEDNPHVVITESMIRQLIEDNIEKIIEEILKEI